MCDYHKDCENGEDEYANCRKLNQYNFVVLILIYIFAVMLFININMNVCYARMGTKSFVVIFKLCFIKKMIRP